MLSQHPDIITTTITTRKPHTIQPRIATWVADIGHASWEKLLDAFDISCAAHWNKKGHRLFAPGALPPRVNLTAQSELSQPHTTTTTTYTSPSIAVCYHSRPLLTLAAARPAPAPAHRLNSSTASQWLRHRRQLRSARKHPLHLCTVHCTTTTSHTPLAVQSEAPRKAIPTPRLTRIAHPKRTSNARPPHQPPARELALPTRISHLRPHHRLHHFDNLSCTRHLARRLPAAHWPTCSASPTPLHTANCQRRYLCFPLPAKLRKSATPRA